LARQLGYRDEDLDTLRAGGMPEHYSPAVRAALTYVAAMAHDAHEVSDDLFGRLSEHWSEAQVLEITAVAAMASYFNRLTAALRIDLSGSNRPYEEGPL